MTVVWLARAAFALYLIGVPVLAILPHSPVPGVPGGDKIAHALAFFLLGCLADAGFPGRHWGLSHFLSLFSVGVLIEILQFHTTYRSASLADLVADATGLGLYLLIRRKALSRARKFRMFELLK